jgi:hypothetical protein
MANWIAGAIKHPGALRKTAGVKKGEKIPVDELEEMAHGSDKKTAARARLALKLRSFHK